MSDELKDHIDEPIKKCVVGLSLLGFKTIMSCCGFSYEEERVPKKHLGKVYIYLLMDNFYDFHEPNLSAILIRLSALSNWKIGPVNGAFFDKGMLFDFHAQPSFLDEAVIRDGNRYYAEKMKGWQYKPKRCWEVKREEYENYKKGKN